MTLRQTSWLRSIVGLAPALGLGLALRLWFVRNAPRVAGDTFVYGGIAKNWLLHGVYGYIETNGVPQPTLIRLPGYPLFLAACFRLFGMEHYAAVLYTQIAVDLLACLLLAALAGRLFDRTGRSRARIATLWLAALCPFTAAYAAAALTETLTLACIALALYALHRWQAALVVIPQRSEGICFPLISNAFNRWLYLLAAALAYSILLRPEQVLLAAALLPTLLVRVRVPHVSTLRHGFTTFTPILTAALLTLLPLLPWTLRNAHTFHVFQPLAPRQATDPGETPPLGFQRWYRTWAIDFASTEDVYWNYDGARIELADIPARAFDTPGQQARTASLLATYNETTTSTPQLDAAFNTLAAERIAAHPVRYYLGLPAARLLNMLLRPRTETLNTPLEWWKFHEHPGQTLFAAAYATLNLAYLALAAWGAALWHRTRRHCPLLYAMLATIALRCALLLTLDNSEPRYTLEFFPILFLLAALPFSRPSVQKQQAAPTPPPVL